MWTCHIMSWMNGFIIYMFLPQRAYVISYHMFWFTLYANMLQYSSTLVHFSYSQNPLSFIMIMLSSSLWSSMYMMSRIPILTVGEVYIAVNPECTKCAKSIICIYDNNYLLTKHIYICLKPSDWEPNDVASTRSSTCNNKSMVRNVES